MGQIWEIEQSRFRKNWRRRMVIQINYRMKIQKWKERERVERL